jgi:hypothetical protein
LEGFIYLEYQTRGRITTTDDDAAGEEIMVVVAGGGWRRVAGRRERKAHLFPPFLFFPAKFYLSSFPAKF